MSKTIWVVERTDNHGEFQPFGNQFFLDRSRAVMEVARITEHDRTMRLPNRSRVVQYVRREVRA